jgi:hypothetical protein
MVTKGVLKQVLIILKDAMDQLSKTCDFSDGILFSYLERMGAVLAAKYNDFFSGSVWGFSSKEEDIRQLALVVLVAVIKLSYKGMSRSLSLFVLECQVDIGLCNPADKTDAIWRKAVTTVCNILKLPVLTLGRGLIWVCLQTLDTLVDNGNAMSFHVSWMCPLSSDSPLVH